MEPPYSAPRLREMRKYAPPPSTSPLVAMADSDVAVSTVSSRDTPMMVTAWKIPAWATTNPMRRNMMTPQMLSNTLECTRYQRSTTKQAVSTGDNAEAPACGLTHQASGVYIPYNDAVERPEPLLSRHFCALFLHLCHKLGSLCKRGAWTADGHRVHPRAHHHRLAGVIEVVVGARHELNGVQVAHTHACFSGGCQLDLRRGNRVAIVGHGGRA